MQSPKTSQVNQSDDFAEDKFNDLLLFTETERIVPLDGIILSPMRRILVIDTNILQKGKSPKKSFAILSN